MSKISGAESQIMEALWGRSPLTAEEIVQSVGPAQGWGEATVKTLINRLLRNGREAERYTAHSSAGRNMSPAKVRACWIGCSAGRWRPSSRTTPDTARSQLTR